MTKIISQGNDVSELSSLKEEVKKRTKLDKVKKEDCPKEVENIFKDLFDRNSEFFCLHFPRATSEYFFLGNGSKKMYGKHSIEIFQVRPIFLAYTSG